LVEKKILSSIYDFYFNSQMFVDPGLLFLGIALVVGLIAIIFFLLRLPDHGDDVAEEYADRLRVGRGTPPTPRGFFRRLLGWIRIGR
jgi:hypothetical protein